MLNYHLNITICKDLACQTLWHNVRHENDNEINWHFYSFKTFKLSFPCIVPKIDNIFWWLIINSNGYTKFENFQKCHTNGAEYRGQTHIYIYMGLSAVFCTKDNFNFPRLISSKLLPLYNLLWFYCLK